MTRCYLAGPITHMEWSDAKSQFNSMQRYAIEELQFSEVVNPVDHQSPDQELEGDELWQHYMRISIRKLSTCDAILLAPNYLISRGARIEKYIADELGLKIYKMRSDYVSE